MELYPAEFCEKAGYPPQAVEPFKQAFRAAWGLTHTLVPYAVETLEALQQKGYRLFAASNSFGHLQRSRLEQAGILHFFEDTYISMDIGYDKPDVRFYEEALRRCGLKPSEVLMVGDSMTTDIIGAQNAGIDSIAALYGYGEKSETLAAKPTHAVETTQALCDLLCPDMDAPKGFFVTLEGVDGCGKSTQAAALKERLEQFGYTVRHTREPGGCPIAEEIRKIVLAKEDGGMCAETEALLFAASRAQHVKEVILPAIERGEIVLCDRFVDSSLVYQGMARGLGLDWVKVINRAAFREGAPGATLYLKMSHEKAMARRMAASQPDRIEKAGDTFHAQTETGFEELARQYPERFIPVNADQAPEQVTEEAFQKLFRRMQERGVL